MNIYASEKHLEKQIRDQRVIQTLLSVKNLGFEPKNSEKLIKDIEQPEEAFSEKYSESIGKVLSKVNTENKDLLHGSAILVSTVMNRNDDVFLSDETWIARATPMHTPFNDSHNQEDIIGHIYDVRALDESGEELDFETDEAPEYFDIEVDFAVYKGIFPEIAAEIADKGPEKEKFVSMEAIISDFDYGIIEDDKIKVIDRNEDTSFLTQNLRAFGGTGSYKGKRIGRVLRGIRFIGMGAVDNPGNEKSEFTSIKSVLQTSIKAEFQKPTIILNSKGKAMKIEDLTQATEKINELQTLIDTLKAENETLTKQVEDQTEAKDKMSKEKKKVEDEKTSAEAKLDVVREKASERQDQIAGLQSELDDTKESLEKAQAEIAELTKEKTVADRLSKLQEANISLTDDRKETVAKMSDEAFEEFINVAKEFAPSKVESEESETKANKVDDETLEAETEEGEEIVASEEEEIDSEVTAAQNLVSAMFGRKRNKTQETK